MEGWKVSNRSPSTEGSNGWEGNDSKRTVAGAPRLDCVRGRTTPKHGIPASAAVTRQWMMCGEAPGQRKGRSCGRRTMSGRRAALESILAAAGRVGAAKGPRNVYIAKRREVQAACESQSGHEEVVPLANVHAKAAHSARARGVIVRDGEGGLTQRVLGTIEHAS